MRFYTQQHRYYCGIDLHAKRMYICILNGKRDIVYHQNGAAPFPPRAPRGSGFPCFAGTMRHCDLRLPVAARFHLLTSLYAARMHRREFSGGTGMRNGRAAPVLPPRPHASPPDFS
jgi:hypothetical protein